MKNWKPLTFDTITENPDATVDEILGDLTSIATLRIKLGRYVTKETTSSGHVTVSNESRGLFFCMKSRDEVTLVQCSKSFIARMVN